MNRREVEGAARRRKGDDVRAVADGLRELLRTLRLSERAVERTAGISGAQLFVLQALWKERSTSLNDLAERTFTDQSSVSVVVRRLVERDLIERRPSVKDARRVELRLTPAGRALLRRYPEPTQTKLALALRALADKELSALRRGVEALVRGLRVDGKAAPRFDDDDESEAGPPGR